jgi:hypothetical protein
VLSPVPSSPSLLETGNCDWGTYSRHVQRWSRRAEAGDVVGGASTDPAPANGTGSTRLRGPSMLWCLGQSATSGTRRRKMPRRSGAKVTSGEFCGLTRHFGRAQGIGPSKRTALANAGGSCVMFRCPNGDLYSPGTISAAVQSAGRKGPFITRRSPAKAAELRPEGRATLPDMARAAKQVPTRCGRPWRPQADAHWVGVCCLAWQKGLQGALRLAVALP